MVRTASRIPHCRSISIRTDARLHRAKGRPSSSGVCRLIRARICASCWVSRNRPVRGPGPAARWPIRPGPARRSGGRYRIRLSGSGPPAPQWHHKSGRSRAGRTVADAPMARCWQRAHATCFTRQTGRSAAISEPHRIETSDRGCAALTDGSASRDGGGHRHCCPEPHA